MPDIGATFGYLGQGQAALDLTGAARGFDRAPGVLSGLRLIDTVAGIIGVDRNLRPAGEVRGEAGAEGRPSLAARGAGDGRADAVPSAQDTGLLLNGIGYRREGGFYVVEATADRGGYDYALAVEAGHHAAVRTRTATSLRTRPARAVGRCASRRRATCPAAVLLRVCPPGAVGLER